MTQAYDRAFARVYNLKWAGFANWVAPLILDFYTAAPAGQERQPVLDLCCGAGHLAAHFLEQGYRVLGLDLSEPMLEHARENNRQYVESGQARFLQADAGDFHLYERFGLVVSTFDALNHLDGKRALRGCFACARAVCDGLFIFDLNTRLGLRRWNNMTVDENSEDATIITRGIYDGAADKAWTRITGFIQSQEGGLYERFEETAFNCAYDMQQVRSMLQEAGWENPYPARAQDLKTPLSDPEQEGRVFFVAGKTG
jgi:SAM-dependent methyltransferase